jgi:glutathione S-transferase
MNTHSIVTFFHAPHSRSGIARAMLEELGAPYDLVVLDLESNEQRSQDYLAINPMGKVPAIRHQGMLITEQPAILLYLADLYAERRIAPDLDDPLRGPYLRWMVFYGSCFEPALVDHSRNRPPVPARTCGYGDYDSVVSTVAAQLEHGPWLLGERFTAADVLWGGAIHWALQSRLLPELPVFRAYAERVQARPGVRRAGQLDAELATEQLQQREALETA